MKLLILALTVLLCTAISPAYAALPPNSAVITMTGEGINMGDVDLVIQVTANGGGHIYHVMPVHSEPGRTLSGCVLIGVVPPAIEELVEALPHEPLLTREYLDPSTVEPMGQEAVFAVNAWNFMLTSVETAEPVPPILNDTREPVGGEGLGGSPPAPRSGLVRIAAPSQSQTSEFMIGRVAIGIVLPESNGSGEDWSTTRQSSVVTEIVAGANWWGTQGGPGANLTFVYDQQMSVATQYEPITLSSSNTDQDTWVCDVLNNMGYTTGDRFQRSYAYVNAIRTSNSADWAFVAYVADSDNDLTGDFSDGSCAFAYLYGPFMIMTYDNATWGIGRMRRVFAHEMGHIFGAPDEYTGPNVYTCNASICNNLYGYLGVTNGNCVSCTTSQVICVMESNDLTVAPCSSTVVHVGWRDSDSDGLLDPVDTMPSDSTTLNYYYPFWIDTRNSNSSASAISPSMASDTAYPSPTRSPVTINTISGVSYQVDSGGWANATPSDGQFNSDSEAFTFTTSSLSDGSHQVDVRSINSVNNQNVSTYSVKIDTSPPPSPTGVSISEAPYSNIPNIATVNWMPQPDTQSGLFMHRLNLVDSSNIPAPGGSAFALPTAQTYQFTTAFMQHGLSYHAHVEGVNNAGLPSAVGENPLTPLTIDMTKPVGPATVSDGGGGTGSTNSLTFSWPAATEDVSGITDYLLTIYDQAGNNLLTDQSIGNVITYTATGLSLTQGDVYYGRVKAVNGANDIGAASAPSDGIMAVVFYSSIGNAKQNANLNDPVGFNNVYITGATTDQTNVIYVEQGDQSSGIMTDEAATALAKGTEVQVAGKIYFDPTGSFLQLIQTQIQKITDPGVPPLPGPVAMNSTALGGAALGLQPGVTNGVGTNTVGLLVRMTGNVTYANSSPPYYFVVDDGGGLFDPSGIQGVGVYSGTIAPPAVGTNRTVTGICTNYSGYPVILLRQVGDWQ